MYWSQINIAKGSFMLNINPTFKIRECRPFCVLTVYDSVQIYKPKHLLCPVLKI